MENRCLPCEAAEKARKQELTAIEKVKRRAEAHSKQTGNRSYEIVKVKPGTYRWFQSGEKHDFEIVEHLFFID